MAVLTQNYPIFGSLDLEQPSSSANGDVVLPFATPVRPGNNQVAPEGNAPDFTGNGDPETAVQPETRETPDTSGNQAPVAPEGAAPDLTQQGNGDPTAVQPETRDGAGQTPLTPEQEELANQLPPSTPSNITPTLSVQQLRQIFTPEFTLALIKFNHSIVSGAPVDDITLESAGLDPSKLDAIAYRGVREYMLARQMGESFLEAFGRMKGVLGPDATAADYRPDVAKWINDLQQAAGRGDVPFVYTGELFDVQSANAGNPTAPPNPSAPTVSYSPQDVITLAETINQAVARDGTDKYSQELEPVRQALNTLRTSQASAENRPTWTELPPPSDNVTNQMVIDALQQYQAWMDPRRDYFVGADGQRLAVALPPELLQKMLASNHIYVASAADEETTTTTS